MLPALQTLSLGARYMVLSGLAFAVMGAFVKVLGARGIPVLEIIVARALVSVLLSYWAIRRRRLALLGNRRALLALRGLVGFIALYCVYYALVHMPFAEATVIQYLHPMFTALLALALLGERPTRATLICIALSFSGLLLIVRPAWLFGQPVGYDQLALLLAVAGAFGSACAYVIVRRLSASEDPAVIVLYFPMVTLPVALWLLGDSFVMPAGWDWLALLMVGVATQVGQVALTRAMQTETASRATSFSYLQVLFATVLGILFFDELPQWWTVAGALLIIAGALVNVAWPPRLPPARPRD